MRLYDSIKKPAKKCSHGIPMEKHCLECLDYQIGKKYGEIKQLKLMKKMILKIQKEKWKKR